jgi:calcium binding protein 39
MVRLVNDLLILPFEARKNVAQIFNNLMRRDLSQFADYVCEHKSLIDTLVRGYENPEIALNCGAILRECIRYENVTRLLLLESQENLWRVSVPFRYSFSNNYFTVPPVLRHICPFTKL